MLHTIELTLLFLSESMAKLRRKTCNASRRPESEAMNPKARTPHPLEIANGLLRYLRQTSGQAAMIFGLAAGAVAS